MKNIKLVDESYKEYHHEIIRLQGLYAIARYEIKLVAGEHICIKSIILCIVSADLQARAKIVGSVIPKKFFFSNYYRIVSGNETLSFEENMLYNSACYDEANVKVIGFKEKNDGISYIKEATSFIDDIQVNCLISVPGEWYKNFKSNYKSLEKAIKLKGWL